MLGFKKAILADDSEKDSEFETAERAQVQEKCRYPEVIQVKFLRRSLRVADFRVA